MKGDDIKTVTVIGAGDMGHGIAEVALMAGYTVYLRDIKKEFVDRGVQRIFESLEKLVQKGKVEQPLFERIRKDLLRPCVDMKEAVKETDLVIEAIPEILELKKETFRDLDKLSPPRTLLASNTSTMRITEIANATRRPDKVVGLHYFNPAVLMKLVEVIKGEETSEESMGAAYDFVVKTRKVPVRVEKDVPGFIVNRVQAPGGVLLGCILDHDIAQPEEVDALLRKLGMPMGPYELMDYTGIDINYHASNYFADAVHPDFAPAKTVARMVQAGHLGKKTGKGFFDWSQGRPLVDPAKATQKVDPMDLLAVQINEATKLIQMGVCSPEDIDKAIVNGTGNAVGPMAVAKGQEPAALSDRLERLATQFKKEIFQPTPMIREGKYR
jgi:enoyl-CoA hydratase/3-hydroxyacyl-CoA dehydrogenase